MRKFLVSILAVLLAVSFCSPMTAAEMDFSSMSDEDLHKILDSSRNELTRRELVAGEKTIIFDQDNVQVYLTGEYKSYPNCDYIELEAVVINDSDVQVSVSPIDKRVSVNGWDVDADGIYDTNAGKKQKGMFDITIADAEITSYEEIEDIDFSFRLFDADSRETISESSVVTVHFNSKAD